MPPNSQAQREYWLSSISTAGGICSKYVGRSVGATRVPARWIAAFKAANAELEKDWSQAEAIEIDAASQKN